MSTLTADPWQESLFDLPGGQASDGPAGAGPHGKAVPYRSTGQAAAAELVMYQTGKRTLPGEDHPHEVTPRGVVVPTVWDVPNVNRVADPQQVVFTREQADAIVLSWVLLHRYPTQQVGAHGAAVKELRGYVDAYLAGHCTAHLWHQHAAAIYALSKCADAKIVRTFVPRILPPATTRRDAGTALAKEAGWGSFLKAHQGVRWTLRRVLFMMPTGRQLTVGVTADGYPPRSWVV